MNNFMSKKKVQTFIVTIIAILLLGITFYDFFVKNVRQMRINNTEYIEVITEQNAKIFSVKINDYTEFIRNISIFLENGGITSVEDNEELFRKIEENSIFDHLRIITPDGISHGTYGAQNDVHDRSYFTYGMNGNYGISEIVRSRIENKNTIIVYSPLRQGNKVVGIVAGVFDVEKLAQKIGNEMLFDNIYTNVVDKNGNVVFGGTKNSIIEEDTNIFEYLNDEKLLRGYDANTFKKDFTNRSKGSFTYKDNGVENICCYAGLGVNGWRILTVLSGDMLRELNDATKSLVLQFIMRVCVIFTALGIFIIYLEAATAKRIYTINKELKELMDMMPVGVAKCKVADDMRLEFINNELLNILGYTKEELIEQADSSFTNVMHSDDVKRVEEILKNEKAGEEIEIQYRVISKDNREKWILNKNKIVEEGRGKKYYYCTFIDITEEKLIEKSNKQEGEEKAKELINNALISAEKANSAKSDFLARMSHDMRTPMNAIMGMTIIAKNHIDDKKRVKDCLDKISVSSAHLLSLINDVLDMSKIESGKEELQNENFELKRLIKQIEAIFSSGIDNKGIEYSVIYGELQNTRLVGDVLKINKIFMNILSNSLKFTPAGGKIEIAISGSKSVYKDYAHFTFVFKDTGVGMKPEFLERMFKPFERENNILVSEREGTGLGMSITKSLVELMNGKISVESEVSKGTTFTLDIDFKLQESQSEEYVVENHREIPDLSGKNILLVEDNMLNMEVAVEILGYTKATIEQCYNGQEAFNSYMRNVPEYYDLIFMDIQMPIMNGLEAAKAIRLSNRKDAKDIPIIAMTANAFSDDVNASFEAGMNAHISKPLNLDELWNKMAQFMRY